LLWLDTGRQARVEAQPAELAVGVGHPKNTVEAPALAAHDSRELPTDLIVTIRVHQIGHRPINE
jgi:hypothetical protein